LRTYLGCIHIIVCLLCSGLLANLTFARSTNFDNDGVSLQDVFNGLEQSYKTSGSYIVDSTVYGSANGTYHNRLRTELGVPVEFCRATVDDVGNVLADNTHADLRDVGWKPTGSIYYGERKYSLNANSSQSYTRMYTHDIIQLLSAEVAPSNTPSMLRAAVFDPMEATIQSDEERIHVFIPKDGTEFVFDRRDYTLLEWRQSRGTTEVLKLYEEFYTTKIFKARFPKLVTIQVAERDAKGPKIYTTHRLFEMPQMVTIDPKKLQWSTYADTSIDEKSGVVIYPDGKEVTPEPKPVNKSLGPIPSKESIAQLKTDPAATITPQPNHTLSHTVLAGGLACLMAGATLLLRRRVSHG